MINFNKSAIVLLIAAGTALAAAPSQAQQKVFASVTGISTATTDATTVFTYTPGAFGGFSISPNAAFSAQYLGFPGSFADPVTFNLTGLSNIGTVVAGQNGFTQQLSGGTFNIESGTTSLLNGTFGSGNLLSGTAGSTTSALTNNLTNVTFTGGTYFTQSGLFNPGSFSISLQGVTPPISAGSDYFNGFQSGGTGNFTASRTAAPTPEPATIVPFIFGGLGLLALAVRKTRRTASVTA